MVGTAGGPLLLGWLYDNAGGFRTSYLAAAACSLVGALVLASGGPLRRETREALAPVSAGTGARAMCVGVQSVEIGGGAPDG
jgi:MFS family permease